MNIQEELRNIFNNINEWLKFAEAKNFGLITLNSAIIIGIFQFNSINETVEKAACYVLIPFLIISSVFSLVSLFPVLSAIEKGKKVKAFLSVLSRLFEKEQSFENIHYFGYLNRIDMNEFILKFNQKTSTGTPHSFTDYEKELITQILYNSRITWLKYQFFKVAGFITLWGLVISALALLVIKFFDL